MPVMTPLSVTIPVPSGEGELTGGDVVVDGLIFGGALGDGTVDLQLATDEIELAGVGIKGDGIDLEGGGDVLTGDEADVAGEEDVGLVAVVGVGDDAAGPVFGVTPFEVSAAAVPGEHCSVCRGRGDEERDSGDEGAFAICVESCKGGKEFHGRLLAKKGRGGMEHCRASERLRCGCKVWRFLR